MCTQVQMLEVWYTKTHSHKARYSKQCNLQACNIDLRLAVVDRHARIAKWKLRTRKSCKGQYCEVIIKMVPIIGW